jgi:cytochrome b6-f complex iron-sulfur subunit
MIRTTEMRGVHAHNNDAKECAACPIAVGRRAFLRDVGLTVTAALIASGLKPGAALASLVTDVRPLRSKGALRTYTIPAGDAVMVDVDNDVIIARTGGKVYAFSRRCPHKGAGLVWHESESRIFCPKHKARFGIDGDHVSGRRSRNLDRYAMRLEGREVVVDTDTVYREDENLRQWQSAVVAAR